MSPTRPLLRLEPVDDHARAEIEQRMGAGRILDQVEHELRGAAHERRGAQRAARRHERQHLAPREDARRVHPDPVQRQRREPVRLDLVVRERVEVGEPAQRLDLARRVVRPELDLGAEHRGLGGHPVLDPPRRHEDDVGEVRGDAQVGGEPRLGIQEVVQVRDAEVARDPGTVDNERHRDAGEPLAARRALEGLPLLWPHPAASFLPGRATWGSR